ncbi:MAG: Coenzyme F420 hydrogenase/dehydrogenase, beta subunit C-terminal domain [Bacillota bacterium]
MPGQEQLKSDILDQGLCSSCGMCMGLCPYIKSFRDKVTAIYPCRVEQGTCFKVCPKVGIDVREMDQKTFGEERKDQALGVLKGIYFAQTRGEKDFQAQYGGVTSTLIALALEEEVIPGAVLTGGDILNPRPVLAKTVQDVKNCAGSKYGAVPTLEVLNRTMQDGMSGVGIVGRPCQITAVRRAQLASGPESRFPDPGFVNLVVGIFCFWALGPEFYHFLHRKIKNERILRMDIPVEGPLIETEERKYRFSLEEFRPFIRKSCEVCFDSTAEWADISVGATEYDPQWNTLIVRSEKGQKILEKALEQEIIELAAYPEERLPLLRKAVLNKKMRILALPELEIECPGYPRISGKYREEILNQWEDVNR